MRFQGARRVHRGTGEGAQVPPGGLAVQFNLRAGQTARRLSITEMTLDPHRLVPPHVRADEDDTHTWRAQIGACRYRPIRARVSSMLATPFASPKNSQASETRSRAESMRKAPPTSRLYGRRRTARPEPGHGTRGAAGCQKLTSVIPGRSAGTSTSCRRSPPHAPVLRESRHRPATCKSPPQSGRTTAVRRQERRKSATSVRARQADPAIDEPTFRAQSLDFLYAQFKPLP